MEVEKDFIQREIQRLTLVLAKLVGKALGLNTDDFEQEFQNIESELKSEFDLTLVGISEMKAIALKNKIEGLDGQHLEKLVELITAVVVNSEKGFGQKLARNGILIIDFLDASSKTFSLRRMELKSILQKML